MINRQNLNIYITGAEKKGEKMGQKKYLKVGYELKCVWNKYDKYKFNHISTCHS